MQGGDGNSVLKLHKVWCSKESFT